MCAIQNGPTTDIVESHARYLLPTRFTDISAQPYSGAVWLSALCTIEDIKHEAPPEIESFDGLWTSVGRDDRTTHDPTKKKGAVQRLRLPQTVGRMAVVSASQSRKKPLRTERESAVIFPCIRKDGRTVSPLRPPAKALDKSSFYGAYSQQSLATLAGFEPATCPLGGDCSIQLSHRAGQHSLPERFAFTLSRRDPKKSRPD